MMNIPTFSKSSQQESFQSMATVFLLNQKTWIEKGCGLVQFVFDLKTYALRLVIEPGTKNQYDCKLRPRIRSKGPRAYVVRAQSDNRNEEEHILAVRFEREEDSRAFRRFVEKRDVDHNGINIKHNKNKSSKDVTNNNITTQLNHLGLNVNNNYYNNTSNGLNTSQLIYQQTQNNNKNKYGWTCSCMQINDINSIVCTVCGINRNTLTNNGFNMNGIMNIGINNMNNINNINTMTLNMNNINNINNIKTIQQLSQMQMKNSLIGSLQASDITKSTENDKVKVLKLTSENLDKHNLSFPQKKRNIKEIIQEQIKYWQYHTPNKKISN